MPDVISFILVIFLLFFAGQAAVVLEALEALLEEKAEKEGDVPRRRRHHFHPAFLANL